MIEAAQEQPHQAAVGPVGQAAQEVLAGAPGRAAQGWLAIVAVVALLAFIVDTILVTSGRLLLGFDLPLERAAQAFNWGPLAPVMTLTNASGGIGQVVIAVVVVVGMFAYERRAGLLMLLGSGASVLDSVLKASIARHRPTTDVVTVLHASAGYSYPSGHAVFFTWVAFMLAVALAPNVRPSRRGLIWVATAAVIFVVCLGRVWAGAHWPSDVIGGFLFALAWSAFILWLPERWLPAPSRRWLKWLPRSSRR